jgi:hypothetical protein
MGSYRHPNQPGWLGLYITSLGDRDLGPVVDFEPLTLSSQFIHDGKLGISIHDDLDAFCIFNVMQILETYPAAALGLQFSLFHRAAGSTTDMEGPHGQLGAGLTDRLCGNYTNRFTDIHHMPTAEVTTVTGGTYFLAGSTGKHRSDP